MPIPIEKATKWSWSPPPQILFCKQLKLCLEAKEDRVPVLLIISQKTDYQEGQFFLPWTQIEIPFCPLNRWVEELCSPWLLATWLWNRFTMSWSLLQNKPWGLTLKLGQACVFILKTIQWMYLDLKVPFFIKKVFSAHKCAVLYLRLLDSCVRKVKINPAICFSCNWLDNCWMMP